MSVAALRLTRASAARSARAAIDCVRLTTPQREWLAQTARIAIWRGGNQIGKSFGQAYDIVSFARGTHPHDQTHVAPVKILVASYSWEQMDPLLERLWELAPKDEVDPKVRYVPGQGIRGYKVPVLPFVAGPGKGSVIYFATYKQGSERIAGGTFHRAYLDEPPPQTVFGEILPRLSRYNGHLRVSFTPTPDSSPLGYLRDLIQERKADEYHTPLSVDAVTPRGGLIERPWKSEREIREFVDSLLPVEREMRANGAWEPLVQGRWLTNYGPHCERWAEPPIGGKVALGIDHGAAAGKQAVVLLSVHQVEDDTMPRVYVLDEHVSDGYTTHDQDAEHIKAMLDRNNLHARHVDIWIGDRPTGANKYGVQKENRLIRRELARIYGMRTRDFPQIDTPHKFDGSVFHGFRMMNSLMGRKTHGGRSHFIVNTERCPRLIEACKAFRGDRRDPHKDVLDACRYAIERAVKIGGWYGMKAIVT